MKLNSKSTTENADKTKKANQRAKINKETWVRVHTNTHEKENTSKS